jgi:uncharacterized Zn-finger protein
MMAHADIKPFQCDWPNCNYRAVSLSYVTNHKKVSHSIKVIKTIFFFSIFIDIFFFQTHTGEKNFECNFPDCNKRFVKASHVTRHQQRCHPEMFSETIISTTDAEEVQVFNINTIEI